MKVITNLGLLLSLSPASSFSCIIIIITCTFIIIVIDTSSTCSCIFHWNVTCSKQFDGIPHWLQDKGSCICGAIWKKYCKGATHWCMQGRDGMSRTWWCYFDLPRIPTPKDGGCWWNRLALICAWRYSIFLSTYRQKLKKEVDRYVEEHQDSRNPLEWWKERSQLYPTVAQVAREILIIPASSVPSEQNFSLAGNIFTKKRSQLIPEKIDLLTSLNRNGC